jgi:hypothetical protein
VLSEPQIERYARHVLLREVGGVGQERLLAARVRVVGLDAPGAWAAAYLALAGVGELQLDDPRPVDDPRPLLLPGDRGRPREVALAEALPSWNPDVIAGRGGAAADLVLRSGDPAPGEIGCVVAGEELLVAWGETCAACRTGLVPRGGPPSPAAAALAGSLAAAEVVLRVLGNGAPRWLRFSGGRPVEVAPCPHR